MLVAMFYVMLCDVVVMLFDVVMLCVVSRLCVRILHAYAVA